MLIVVAFVAAVLPGLRRIRTPLFIGYCWIGALWLIFRPRLPTRDQASGTIETIYEIAAVATKVGVMIAVTVLAYAIGSLTVLFLMWILSLLPIPVTAKTTKSYVRNGVLPPELYRMDGFPSEFNRVCAEAQFRWSTPLPVMLVGLYLAYFYSVWWILPFAVVPLLLMADGYRCWVLACRMLSGAHTAQGSQRHAGALPATETG